MEVVCSTSNAASTPLGLLSNHELRLHYQRLALFEALNNKTETDPSDQISGRMLNQFEEIVNRIRDVIVRGGLTQNHA